VVQLTPTADIGWTFTGWSGACSGAGACSVTMDAAKSVTATFRLNTYIITGNAGVAGATINYAGGSTTANESGSYTITVSYGWSGTVTPSKTGYTFMPASRDYPNVTANKSGEDYAATPTYYSNAINDGWTLESKEYSNVAGTKNNAGTLRVGDDALKRQYRSILYFDTTNLPDKAVITQVTLLVRKESVMGDPLATLGNLVADIKKGYFGLAPLELRDFNAAAEPVNTGKLSAVPGSDWYQLKINPLHFKYINVFGATQFRLRFTRDDDNDKFADFISFYAGDAATADQPQLLIEYHAP